MSQLSAPTHTLADSIPLGRRITEIMAEKGPAYTIAAMAKRLDINRETLRLMLKGEREIYTFELEKIAQDLKVPVERILQSDLAEESRKLKLLLIKKDKTEHTLTLELAQKLADISIGLTERCIAENDLSFAYRNLNLDDAVSGILARIVKDAELILEKYEEPEIYLWIVANTMHLKMRKKDYSNLAEMVAKVEPYFTTNPRVGGSICFTVARIKQDVERDYQGAREKYLQMLGYYEKVNETISLARAQATVGQFEYQQGNYEDAQKYLYQSWRISCLEQDLQFRLITSREFGRLLIRIGQQQEAFKILNESIELVQEGNDVDLSAMEAQLLLLLIVATNDPTYAETIVNRQIGSISVRHIALKFLMEYFEQTGDREALDRYENIKSRLPGSPIDILLRYKKMDKEEMLNLFDFCLQHNWHQ